MFGFAIPPHWTLILRTTRFFVGINQRFALYFVPIDTLPYHIPCMVHSVRIMVLIDSDLVYEYCREKNIASQHSQGSGESKSERYI